MTLQTKQLIDVEKIRQDFPILKIKVNGKPLVYLDNAATTQKPAQVINKIKEYYETSNANVHRGIHYLSEKATLQYEKAHEIVGNFINSDFEEMVFTKNATESLNLLAYSLTKNLVQGDEILLSQMEHHSNIVPWQQIAKEKKLVLKFIKITSEGLLDLQDLKNQLNKKTKMVSIMHVSNVLGTINPVKEIAKLVHDNNSLFILDAAQSIPHMKVDVKDIDCDFAVFSSHKMIGPTGIGVLYGKKNLLQTMSPFLYGGDMIKQVEFTDSKWNDLPWKFEAGTPNIAGAIAFAEAINYLENIGMDNIPNYEKELTKYAFEKLSQIDGLIIYGPKDLSKRAGLIAFNLGNIHAHDVATILNDEGIAIRGGHHCAMPLMNLLGVTSTARASFYFYNTKQEIDLLVNALQKAKRFFGEKDVKTK